MAKQATAQAILATARTLLAEGGLGAVSFDAIAARIGRSKQAVLYWFPTKRDLLAALFVPWLEAETNIAEAAVAEAASPELAIAAFVRSVARFHLGDLDRFRMMYLVPQTTATRTANQQNPHGRGVVARVHPVTDRLYGALAAQLRGNATERRQAAVSIHAAVLGLILMVALGDAIADPLKHDPDALIEALVAQLTGQTGGDS